MAWEHEKSGTTILLDILRYMLIVGATGYAVFLIWKWNWMVALIAVIPVYVVMLNLVGFLTLPLYGFTPENRLRARMLKAMHNNEVEEAMALGNEFEKKFNVNVPEEAKAEKREDL